MEKKKTRNRKETSIREYLITGNDRLETLSGIYALASKQILSIIQDYKTNRTNLQKPEKGWFQPVMRKCPDDGCVECPHRIEWRLTYWNANMIPPVFQSSPITVDRSTIMAAGSHEARKQVDEILAVKDELESLQKLRKEIRACMRNHVFKSDQITKSSLALVKQ